MINKDNLRIDITLNKADFQKLKLINADLNKRFNLDLTKSQTIKFLINDYKLNFNCETAKPKAEQPKKTKAEQPQQTTNQKTKEQTDILKAENKRKLNELKERLNISIKDLAELLNINFETMRDYFKGRRLPTGENETIINECFIKYGIN